MMGSVRPKGIPAGPSIIWKKTTLLDEHHRNANIKALQNTRIAE
jgi:hypothetical protein